MTEREEFEEWLNDNYGYGKENEWDAQQGCYVSIINHCMYQAYQAATAKQAEKIAELEAQYLSMGKSYADQWELREQQLKLMDELVDALKDLKAQVIKFCETEGEWEFYTGTAQEALSHYNEMKGK